MIEEMKQTLKQQIQNKNEKIVKEKNQKEKEKTEIDKIKEWVAKEKAENEKSMKSKIFNYKYELDKQMQNVKEPEYMSEIERKINKKLLLED
jgi:hypothetical protein